MDTITDVEEGAAPMSAQSQTDAAAELRRAKTAAKRVVKADQKIAAHRPDRELGAVIAHLDYGVPPVTLYRDTIDVSRGLFNRMLQRAPNDADRARIIAEHADRFGSESTTMATLRKVAKTIARAKADKKAALKDRDETMRRLVWDLGVSNADVARATGLTTARVAQLVGPASQGLKQVAPGVYRSA